MTQVEDEAAAEEKVTLTPERQPPVAPVTNKLTLRVMLPQIFASVAAQSAYFSTGIGIGFSAVLLPQLEANNTSISITPEQASWIAGLLPMSTVWGAVVAAWLVDLRGRRFATMVQSVPLVISWLLTAWAPDLSALYAARILIGVVAGMVTTSIMYVTEISHPSLRGALCNLALLWGSAGTFIAYILGTAFPWRQAALISAITPLVTLISLYFTPESPRWLLATEQPEAAEKAMHWIYSSNPVLASQQWNYLQTEVSTTLNKRKTLKQRLHLLFRISTVKPLGVLFGFFFFQQITGSYVVLFYTVDLFQRVGSGLDPYISTIITGGIRMFTSGLAVIVSQHVGRRPLALFSGTGMALTMGVAGISLYQGSEWISFACLLIYMFSSAMGFLCLPWSMTAELLPLDMRGIGGILSNTTNYLLMFAVLKAYPPLAAHIEAFVILGFFSVTSIIGTVFVFVFLPETRGKTLLEIEQYFSRNKKHNKRIGELG